MSSAIVEESISIFFDLHAGIDVAQTRFSGVATSRPFQSKTTSRRGAELYCGQLRLSTLAAEYGTPLYVYSADHILDRLELFQRALAGREHLLCYAVKANSALALLRLLAEHGAGFDIVSGGELERVRAAAPEALSRVVFSGAGKTAEEMDLALEAEILSFQVESEAELALLAQRAARMRRKARFSLRVNPDVFAATHPYISTGLSEHKFGIPIAQARRIYGEATGRAVRKQRWLEAYGVSVHIGSQIRSAEPFGAAMARVARLVRELERDGISLRSVDAGGGLGIDYEDAAGFDPAAAAHAYLHAMEQALDGLNVRLVLEPGRFLVAQSGALLTRVLYVKKNGRKTFVITDAGMNDLIRPALYQAWHEIVAVQPRTGRAITADVVGPVCESGDFFARDRRLSPVEPGDLMAILDAGAYGMAQSSNYNSRPRPAELLVQGREARLIRRRETMAELFAPEMEQVAVLSDPLKSMKK